jgi:putative cell wall-binding protein
MARKARFLAAVAVALWLVISTQVGPGVAIAAGGAVGNQPMRSAVHPSRAVDLGVTHLGGSAAGRATPARIPRPLAPRTLASVRPRSGIMNGPKPKVVPVVSQAAIIAGVPGISTNEGHMGPIDGWYGCGATPCFTPWVSIASGPYDQVIATNDDLEVTATGARLADSALYFFFNEDGNQLFDGQPQVAFRSDRWYAVETSFDCTAGHIYVADSQSSDPTGGWHVYRYDFPGLLVDSPTLGLGSNLVVGANTFTIDNPSSCQVTGYAGAILQEVDGNDIFNDSVPHAEATSPDPDLWSYTPVVGADVFPVEVLNGAADDVGVTTVSGQASNTTFAASTVDLTTGAPNVAALTPPPTLPALGSPAQPSIDERPATASWSSNELAFSATTSCQPAGDTTTRACARITDLIDTAGTWSISQDFVIGVVGQDIFAPGVVVQSSFDPHLAIVYSQAASTMRAPISAMAAYQLQADAPGSIHTPAVTAPATTGYLGTFWAFRPGIALSAQIEISPGKPVWQASPYSDDRGDWTIAAATLDEAAEGADVFTGVTPYGPNDPFMMFQGSQTNYLWGATLVRMSNDPTTTGGVLNEGRDYPIWLGSPWSLADPTTGGSPATGSRAIYYQGGDGVGDWGPVESFTVDVTPPATVSRLSGLDRYGTAASISAADFPVAVWGGSVVYVTAGNDFPDALAGAAAAGQLGAPLLLVTKTSVPSATVTELKRLKPDTIIILGGTGAVSNQVEYDLSFYVNRAIYRLGGVDRYGTATLVSETNFSPGVPVAFVASGANFPDALAGAAAAGVLRGPVLLVPGASIPGEVGTELSRLKPQEIVVLGGTASVSAAVQTQLATYVGGDGSKVLRWAGPDRFGTAAAISQATYPTGRPLVVYIADGLNFPDALAGAPVAGSQAAPLLLVRPTSIPSATIAELIRLHPYRIVVLGGTASVSAAVMSALATYAGP